MSASFQDYLDESSHVLQDVEIGAQTLTRVYVIPIGGESLIPARGSIVTLRSISAFGSNQGGTWRVRSTVRQKIAAGYKLQVTFYRVNEF